MGYDQYTVPDNCSCRTYFCCFPLALANTFPWPFVPILSNFFEKKRTKNHPQCLSGLSRPLFPTTFLEIAVSLIFLYISNFFQTLRIFYFLRRLFAKRRLFATHQTPSVGFSVVGLDRAKLCFYQFQSFIVVIVISILLRPTF